MNGMEVREAREGAAHGLADRSVIAALAVTGITAVALFVAIRVFVVPEDAPLHAWAGIAQRTVLAVLFPCIVVLALRLLRVTRAADAPR